ncbi:MAG: hypothetical protein HY219_00390 [Candidatus Staskawiczbacteria bacterium]|nr:hypothetical protein [Candidatus Staskawiczbacteria bacterium]
MKNLKYKIIGGITSVIIIMLYFAFIQLSRISLDVDKDIYQIIAPILFIVAIGGSPIGILGQVVVIVLSLIPYFIIGAILGDIYGNSIHKKRTIVIIIIICVLFFGALTFRYSNLSNGIIFNDASVNKCKFLAPFLSILKHRFNSDKCYYSLARKNKDVTACEYINIKSYLSRDCFMDMAQEYIDYNICSHLDEISNKESCIDLVAGILGECEKAPTLMARNYCYLDRSKSIREHARDNTCAAFLGPKNRELCDQYREEKITIKGLCENIKDKKLISECFGTN